MKKSKRTRILKNIYSHKELNKSPRIKNLESYDAIFQKLLKILIFMENDVNKGKT